MDPIGQLIITEQQCDDSMAWARQMVPLASDGTVLITRELTKARGRQGRRWVLASGQITHTLILKPALPAPNEQALATLTMALTLGLWAPFQHRGVTLKWPNDLYLNNKKLGGMLLENLWQDGKLAAVIAGYSININNSCCSHDVLSSIATSLNDETGQPYDLGALQLQLFGSLSQFYRQWQQGEYQEIFQLWRRHQGYLGKPIKVHNRDGSLLEGIAQDVLPNGDLILHLPVADRTYIITFAQVEEVII